MANDVVDPELLRAGIALLKDRFGRWCSPPLALPAESVLEDVVRALLQMGRTGAHHLSRGPVHVRSARDPRWDAITPFTVSSLTDAAIRDWLGQRRRQLGIMPADLELVIAGSQLERDLADYDRRQGEPTPERCASCGEPIRVGDQVVTLAVAGIIYRRHDRCYPFGKAS